jgi:hypothetical protein
MLEKLDPRFTVLASGPPATGEEIEALEAHFGHIPPDYRELIGEVTDLEMEHDYEEMYVRIWGPKFPPSYDRGYKMREQIPGVFPIGDDGGNRILFLHDGKRGPGLYFATYGDFNAEAAVWLAGSLRDLLERSTGIEILESDFPREVDDTRNASRPG